ncbi:hypothetical protein D3C80_1763380 [compost metagenome]
MVVGGLAKLHRTAIEGQITHAGIGDHDPARLIADGQFTDIFQLPSERGLLVQHNGSAGALLSPDIPLQMTILDGQFGIGLVTHLKQVSIAAT